MENKTYLENRKDDLELISDKCEFIFSSTRDFVKSISGVDITDSVDLENSEYILFNDSKLQIELIKNDYEYINFLDSDTLISTYTSIAEHALYNNSKNIDERLDLYKHIESSVDFLHTSVSKIDTSNFVIAYSIDEDIIKVFNSIEEADEFIEKMDEKSDYHDYVIADKNSDLYIFEASSNSRICEDLHEQVRNYHEAFNSDKNMIMNELKCRDSLEMNSDLICTLDLCSLSSINNYYTVDSFEESLLEVIEDCVDAEKIDLAQVDLIQEKISEFKNFANENASLFKMKDFDFADSYAIYNSRMECESLKQIISSNELEVNDEVNDESKKTNKKMKL